MISGQKLAHYEILASIGRGGMGEVYRAKDAKLGRDVAIKVLPEEFSRNQERLARFNREAKVLASLNHPNIAAIYGLEESDGTHYLVLELVEGETLAERIARGPLALEEAVAIAVEIAHALEEAHERGIVHRDLKPANIKCSPEERVKVLDFGLAKALAEETPDADLSISPTITRDATRAGVILGTAAYMSPEQAKGRRVDKRTDIFAFGAVLFEMLSGKKAFSGDDVSEVLAAVIKLEPDWTALPKSVSRGLENVLRRCLEKDPKKRRRDIGDVRSEIEEAVAAPAMMEPRGLQPKPGLRRLLGAAALVIFGVLTAFAAWNLKPTPPQPTRRLVVTLPEGARFSYMGRGVVAVSPDGSHLAFVARGQIHLRPLDEMEATPLPGTERARSPVFSPDGRWIAFYSDGALKKISVSGGAPIRLAPAGVPFGISWATDDSILYGAGSEGIFRVPAEGGDLERVVELSEGERVYGPQLLPEGKHILFTVTTGGWEEGALVAQSLETGERRVVVPGGNDGRYLPSGHLVFAIGATLMAVPFDPRTLEVRGTPVPVVEDMARSETNTAAAQFSCSDEGTLAFVSGAQFGYDFAPSSLVWIDRQGVVEPSSQALGAFKKPRLSPDGRRVAVEKAGQGFGGFGDVWLLDLERDTLSRLTTEGGSNPLWSSDGEWVVFQQEGIYRTRADFSGRPERILSGEMDPRPYSRSRDGRWLVFGTSVRIENEDLWLYPLESGEAPRALTDSRYSELSGEISPDGRWIAYYSSESGRGEIYVQPFPGPGPREQVSTDGGMNPGWSRDGRELYFQNSGALYVVEVISGTKFQSSRPVRLFDLPEGEFGDRDWDVSPDGKRFMAVLRQGSGTGRGEVKLVLDWFQELERLAPTH